MGNTKKYYYFWVSLLKFYRKVLATSNKWFVFNLSNCFPTNTFVHYFVMINNWTRLPAIDILTIQFYQLRKFHKILNQWTLHRSC